MAVESVTVVAPEVGVGPFSLSKGFLNDLLYTLHAEIIQILYNVSHC